MTSEEVLQIFRDTGALLEGHFLYASGRHGRQFLQAARVLQYPEHTGRLCKAMADHFAGSGVDLVCGPATGGILLAYETARHLGCRSVFAEKDGEGGMAVKRGFHLKAGSRCLVVEDIVTTGGSVHKTIDHLRARGVEVVGVGVLVDRSGGEAAFDCPFHALATIQMDSYAPDALPDDLQGTPPLDPDDIVIEA